jgi:hypothetical protein
MTKAIEASYIEAENNAHDVTGFFSFSLYGKVWGGEAPEL